MATTRTMNRREPAKWRVRIERGLCARRLGPLDVEVFRGRRAAIQRCADVARLELAGARSITYVIPITLKQENWEPPNSSSPGNALRALARATRTRRK